MPSMSPVCSCYFEKPEDADRRNGGEGKTEGEGSVWTMMTIKCFSLMVSERGRIREERRTDVYRAMHILILSLKRQLSN